MKKSLSFLIGSCPLLHSDRLWRSECSGQRRSRSAHNIPAVHQSPGNTGYVSSCGIPRHF